MHVAAVRANSSPSAIPRLILILILSLSAYIQFAVVSRTQVDTPLRADASEYFSYAYNLHYFGVYSLSRTWALTPTPQPPIPDKVRTPGYSLFLLAAGTPEPTESFLHRIYLLQAGLGVLSVWLVYSIAASFLNDVFALGVAFASATSPQLATISTYVLSESLFLFLLLASTFVLIKAVATRRSALFAIAGLLWGLSSLVRPTAEYLPAILMISVLFIAPLRKFAKPALLAFSCYLAVLTPWAIRNQSVVDPSPSLLVKTLAHGSYPGFMYENRPETFGYPYRFDPDQTQNSRDVASILSHIARQFAARPVEYLKWYIVGKPYFFLSLEDVQSFDILIYPTIHTPYYEDIRFAVLRKISLALHWPFMILALLGVAMLAIRPERIGLSGSSVVAARVVAVIIGYAIIFHVVAAPFPRYAIPFRPLLFALAALPLQATILLYRKRPAGRN